MPTKMYTIRENPVDEVPVDNTDQTPVNGSDHDQEPRNLLQRRGIDTRTFHMCFYV